MATMDVESSSSQPVDTNTKRALDEEEGDNDGVVRKRPRPDDDSSVQPKKRWRAHQMAEDYISLVGNLMYHHPSSTSLPFGHYPYNVPIERVTTLGYLSSPLRRPTVIEQWSPYEIAKFEASIMLHGKHFHLIQADIGPSKTTKSIVEFYYIWKKTSHYKVWKQQYKELEHLEESSDDEEERSGKETKPKNGNSSSSK